MSAGFALSLVSTEHSQNDANEYTLRLCGLRNSSAILATLKNFDWHWQSIKQKFYLRI